MLRLLAWLSPRITSVKLSYGRTVVLPKTGRGFAEEKVWAGWEVEVNEGEDRRAAMAALRAEADVWEVEERKAHAERGRYK